jgi:hypothetical protein
MLNNDTARKRSFSIHSGGIQQISAAGSRLYGPSPNASKRVESLSVE